MGRFLDFLGLETRATQTLAVEGEGIGGILPPRRNDTSSVSVDRALTIPAVFASFRILSTAISQLKMGVWRDMNGKVEELPTPPVVRRPNLDQTLSQFLKRTTISLASSGNAYWRTWKNTDGSLANVQVLNPLAISIRYDDRGNKVYDYADPYQKPGQSFTSKQVQHLRLLEVPGYVKGFGPIQSCRASLAGSLDLQSYADGWFSNSSIPTGVLSTDLQLTTDEADAYKKRWHETQATRDVAVLGKGLNYSPIILNPADAQFLESRQFSVTDIARLFGVPASYLLAEVNGSSLTYTNIEQVDTQFLRYTLMQYLKEIEDAFSDLLVRNQWVEFKVDGLLRPDAKTLSEIHQTYVDMGALSPQEAREQKGWSGPAPTPPKPEPAPEAAPDQEVIPSV